MSAPRRVAEAFGRRVRAKVLWEADRLVAGRVGSLDHLRWQTPIAASRTGHRMLFDTRDRELGPQIWADGTYDAAELAWILDHLGHPEAGRTVVEIGANVGTTTVALLGTYGAAAVEAWEPAPGNVRLLRCNLILNDLDGRCVVHPEAVSDRAATVELELSNQNPGDHRIVAVDRTWEVQGEAERPTTTVVTRRLDDALGADPADVGLVWVDTQGHEAHVLEGASRLLGRGIPWVVEFWPYGLTRAGGLDRFVAAVGGQFSSIVDVRRSQRAGRTVELDAGDLPGYARELGTGYTDLILRDGSSTTDHFGDT